MSLQDKASQDSGVSQEEAFKIDQVNLYERLGRDVFVQLSTEFYNRVYSDPDAWFLDIFASSPKDAAIQNQYEFFIQRMGGPPLYSQRKGHPALIGRHARFDVSPAAAERWLLHMNHALDATPVIDEDSRRRMFNFFKHTAYFLVHGNAITKARQAQE
jgi:truncated hemoglobin YjbI